MPVTDPHELDRNYADAFNAKDIDRLVSLYAADAIYVPPLSHQAVKGRVAIKDALQHSLAVDGTMSLETTYCYQAGDIALLRSKWRIAGTAPDGKPVQMAGISNAVARRQGSGEWLYIIDHPLGADPKEHAR